MTVNFPGGGGAPAVPSPRRVEQPIVKTSSSDNSTAPQKPEIRLPDQNLTDQKRAETVQRVAQAIQRDFFAVSDTKFTIFKDGAGQYITRITSLRDGRITYIPEPKIYEYLDRTLSSRHSLVELSV
jgi:hypothetical protein